MKNKSNREPFFLTNNPIEIVKLTILSFINFLLIIIFFIIIYTIGLTLKLFDKITAKRSIDYLNKFFDLFA